MYSRFFTKALRDLNYFNLDEPFEGLFTQGMVTHTTYRNKNGEWVEPKNVESVNGKLVDNKNIDVETGKVEKMSKSKKNVVDPNDIIDTFGADTARWFMLSDSPPERDLQWSNTGIAASYKFINRLYELVEKLNDYKSSSVDDFQIIEELKYIINQITENIDTFQFNKSVAKIYEFVNVISEALSKNKLSKENFKWSLNKLSLVLQPFVPHISEEIWSKIGGGSLCINEDWPIEKTTKKTKIKIALQINGKTKDVIEVDEKLDKEQIIKIVKNNNKIKKNIIQKKIIKEIYVPNKIVNLVIS